MLSSYAKMANRIAANPMQDNALFDFRSRFCIRNAAIEPANISHAVLLQDRSLLQAYSVVPIHLTSN